MSPPLSPPRGLVIAIPADPPAAAALGDALRREAGDAHHVELAATPEEALTALEAWRARAEGLPPAVAAPTGTAVPPPDPAPHASVRIVGPRYCPDTHGIKDFLARNLIPYRWLDIERSPEARALLREHAGTRRVRFPLVILPDGAHLEHPSAADLAGHVGLRTQAERRFYDVAIVGAGPAGLAAAVYAASEGLRTVMIEGEAPGGQAGASARIDNYLGFPAGLSGADLARRGLTQAEKFGAELLSATAATALDLRDDVKLVTLASGDVIAARALLIATGVSWRRLDAPGAEALTGKGIYYGAARVEAPSCRDEVVHLAGGGNSAGQAAMFFAQYAREVQLVVREDSIALAMSQYLVDQIAATPNIVVRTETTITRAHGTDRLEALTLRDERTGAEECVAAGALYVFIGAEPRTAWLGERIARDEAGYVCTGERLPGWPLAREPMLLETSVPGIFAAGDVRRDAVKRVASAVGDGAIAVALLHRYLADL